MYEKQVYGIKEWKDVKPLEVLDPREKLKWYDVCLIVISAIVLVTPFAFLLSIIWN